MIKELAFTPHIFDEEINGKSPDWYHQLLRLGEKMNIDTLSIFPLVISDLCGGGWSSTALEYIDNIKDNIVKNKAKELYYDCFLPILVKRRIYEWPDHDEIKWIEEALNVSKEDPSPLHRIVTTTSVAKSFKEVHALADVSGNGFWRGLKHKSGVPKTIPGQIKCLKPLCYHADYLAIISAYFNPVKGPEAKILPPLIEMIRSIKNSDKQFLLDIHCEASTGSITQTSPEVKNFIGDLKAYITDDIQLTLYYWPKLTERRIFAGSQRDVSENIRMKILWGLSITHFARSGASEEDDTPRWHFLERSDFKDEFQRYYQKQPLFEPIKI